MTKAHGQSGFDGTTGRSDHGGRRTHIIQLLRDAKEPISVSAVAEKVGIHVNTARFHLESLVDAGMAERTQQARDTPGRPKVLYIGTLPNQTHERAQGYRLLAEILTTTVAQSLPHAPDTVLAVGQAWGRYLTETPAPFTQLSETEVFEQLISKMDALWFAPTLAEPGTPPRGVTDRNTDETDAPDETMREAALQDVGVQELLMHNCPFLAAAQRHPDVVCTLHAGLINGTLAELNSTRRAIELIPLAENHLCVAHLATVDPATFDDSAPVAITRTT